jgi:hypothetical protein
VTNLWTCRYFNTNQTIIFILRRVWRYQRGNQNLYIEEEQTTPWPKVKIQKDKQRSTKHTYKTKVSTLKVLWSTPRLGWPLWNICVTNDHGYVPLVVNTSRSFPHCWLIPGFATEYRIILHMQVLLECCYIWMESSQWSNCK